MAVLLSGPPLEGAARDVLRDAPDVSGRPTCPRSACRAPCSAVQCSAVQCSAVQCSAVQCSAAHELDPPL